MSEPPPWQGSLSKRIQVRVIAALGYGLVAALCRTLRFQVEGWGHFETAAGSDRPPIVVGWHGRLLALGYGFRRRGLFIITSQNFDGEWMARILHRLGHGTVRGSSSRNASGALREMTRLMRAGHGTAITVDGPTGPARRAKGGAVWLAKATGSPIVPSHAEARRAWTLRSWDSAQVPRPFSKVAFVVGEPLWVDRDADEAGLEKARLELEARLEALRRRALELVGRQET